MFMKVNVSGCGLWHGRSCSSSGADSRGGYFRLVYLANEETLGIAFNEIGEFLLMEHVALESLRRR
jgi:hypothetical protein